MEAGSSAAFASISNTAIQGWPRPQGAVCRPCDPRHSGKEPKPQWHTHSVGFQLFYVTKGWIEFEYEDIGKVRLEAGGSAFQPPGVRHRELCHSDDLEVLEIASPAGFGTTLVDEL